MAGGMKSIILYILTEFRGIFVVCFLLPMSIIMNTYNYLRMQYRIFANDAKNHDQRVAKIAADMRRLHEESLNNKNAAEICTAKPGWSNMSIKVGEHKVNKRKIKIQLTDILEVNEKELYVRVEPLVSMGQITAFLNPRGYTLPVVPELDELTAGGLICGFGVESSCHIYGLFQEICTEYELVLADGRVVIATATNQYKDLFYSIPWSHGSIAMLVSAKIRIIPAKKYVTLRYRRTEGLKAMSSALADAAGNKDPAFFVEGLQITKERGVLMEGRLSDKIEGTYNDISIWYKKWFYLHADEVVERLQANNPDSYVTETIPLRSYYHRHTKSIFFEMPHIIPFADSLWFRYLLGWALPPNIPLLKVSQTEDIRKMWREQFCVQDMLVPMSKLDECLNYCDDRLAIYPIWLCPHLVVRHETGGMLKPSRFVSKDTEKEMYVDVGLYGVPARQPFNHFKELRGLEEYVRSVDGYQGLYAVIYAVDSAEFRQMFDHTLYDKVRTKYGCNGRFPECFKKVADPSPEWTAGLEAAARAEKH